MPNTPRSSFIPKESSAIPTRVRRRRTFSIFNFIASTLFIVSLLLAVGVNFYERNKKNELQSVKDELAQQKTLIENLDARIGEIRRFDRQVKAATLLLKNHIAPTKLLDALEMHTKEQVQLTNMTLENDPGFNVVVTVDGLTKEFTTVALQEIETGKNPLLTSMVLDAIGESEGVSGDTQGETATFSLKGIVAIEVLGYDGSIPNGLEAGSINTTSDSMDFIDSFMEE